MLKQLSFEVAQAVENIRTNLFHTLLSILGIVIGVASLVTILSLIDGMQKYATDQISMTTDLKNILIRPVTHKTIQSIRIKKDSLWILNEAEIRSMQDTLKTLGEVCFFSQRNVEFNIEGDTQTLAATIQAISPTLPISEKISFGRAFTAQEISGRSKVVILNSQLVKNLTIRFTPSQLLSYSIRSENEVYRIIGITQEGRSKIPAFYIPMSTVPLNILKSYPPTGIVEAHSIEQVPEVKSRIQSWLSVHRSGSGEDFEVVSNEFRVDQIAKGFVLFRWVMGLIVGISVLVGGIGVMNVLLISVTERTAEIGMRKALGANKGDIQRLFLSESILLSIIGSGLGLVLGILMSYLSIPILKAITKVSFEPVFSLNTLLVITGLAVVIGMVFGTYPARKASQLNPVDAIQHV